MRVRGLSLAEMLVALALGLATVLIAGRLLLLATRAQAAQAEAAALDDGGRYAAELLGRAVRQAGYVDAALLAAPDAAAAVDAMPAAVAGYDARSLSRTANALDDPLPDQVNGSDVLALRFPGAGALPGGDGSMASCAGVPVAQGEQGWSIFYVARNADGEAELRCKYRGAANWSADALVSGVDGFQVLYGLDTDTPPDGVPNRYVNADAIRALDAALPAGLPPGQFNRITHWKRVASVRVGLLLHGIRPTRADSAAGVYRLLGPGASDPGDAGSVLDEATFTPEQRRRERRLFSMTFALERPLPVAMPAAPPPSPGASP
ncbi:PilW family protein [Massilia sp. 9096]|uniref:PilW family protein n=1 Tax=Massilia sp. 9096 TaxID=1500894 RepID=UPI000562723A|nr:PilW family protein [Massilia sp. 9096]